MAFVLSYEWSKEAGTEMWQSLPARNQGQKPGVRNELEGGRGRKMHLGVCEGGWAGIGQQGTEAQLQVEEIQS
jgi:hypothetical protein